jgi:hypothetical protein
VIIIELVLCLSYMVYPVVTGILECDWKSFLDYATVYLRQLRAWDVKITNVSLELVVHEA